MLRILKSLNSSSEPKLPVGEEKKFTRFETAQELAQVGQEAQLTRARNTRVREQVQIERQVLRAPAPEPQAPVTHVSVPEPKVEPKREAQIEPKPEPKAEVQPVATPKVAQSSAVPISADVLRKALPMRFAEMKLDLSEQEQFAD